MDNLIGSKIRMLRRKNRLSQKELCGDFIDRTLLSKMENNRLTPSIAQLRYFANKLNTPISYFLSEMDYVDYVGHNSNNEDDFLHKLYDRKNYEKIIDIVKYSSNTFNEIEDFNKHFYVGMSYFNMNMKSESIGYLRKYINSYLRAEENKQALEVINFANALNTLCKIMLQNSNYIKAAHYLYMAKKYLFHFKKSDSLINFIVHNNLGFVYNRLNKYSLTISALEEFLSLNSSLCYLQVLPHIHWSLNIAYYNINDFENSIKHIKKSIYLFSYMDEQIKLGRCYVNYINTLRYCRKFKEAFEVIEKCKVDFLYDELLYCKIVIQELTINFNLNSVEKVLSIYDKMPKEKLNKANKMDCCFMLGHTYYLNKNFTEAERLFSRCEKYFISKNYTYDLSLMYEDLYNMTKDKQYLDKLDFYKNKVGRKNILV